MASKEDLKKVKSNDPSFFTLVLNLSGDTELKPIRKAVEDNTVVHEVKLKLHESFNQQDPEDMVSLFKAIGSMKNLKYLGFGDLESPNPEFAELSVEALTACLKKVGERLLWLYIRGVILTVNKDEDEKDDVDESKLSKKDLKAHLKKMEKNATKRAKKAFAKLGEAMIGLKNLEKCSFMSHFNEDLGSCTMDPVMSGVVAHRDTLQIVVIGMTRFEGRVEVDSSCIQDLFKIKSMTQLRLMNVAFGLDHFKGMAESISKLENLESLYLVAEKTFMVPAPSDLSEEEAKKLKEEKKKEMENKGGQHVGLFFRNTCLKKLQVLNYVMDTADLVGMGVALSTNKTLTELEFFCALTERHTGSLALSQMLLVNDTLETLHMHMHQLLDKDCLSDIVKAIKSNKSKTMKRFTLQWTTEYITEEPKDIEKLVSKALGDSFSVSSSKTGKDNSDTALVCKRK